MIRVAFLAMFVSAASAGVISGGYGLELGLGHGAVAVAAPAVAVAHGASSYQNSNLLALNPTAVVTKVAAPVAIAAPVAPVAYGHYGVAPSVGVGLGIGFGKSVALGYH